MGTTATARTDQATAAAVESASVATSPSVTAGGSSTGSNPALGFNARRRAHAWADVPQLLRTNRRQRARQEMDDLCALVTKAVPEDVPKTRSQIWSEVRGAAKWKSDRQFTIVLQKLQEHKIIKARRISGSRDVSYEKRWPTAPEPAHKLLDLAAQAEKQGERRFLHDEFKSFRERKILPMLKNMTRVESTRMEKLFDYDQRLRHVFRRHPLSAPSRYEKKKYTRRLNRVLHHIRDRQKLQAAKSAQRSGSALS